LNVGGAITGTSLSTGRGSITGGAISCTTITASSDISLNGQIKNNNFQTIYINHTPIPTPEFIKEQAIAASSNPVAYVVTTITCEGYYKKDIFFSIPISSYSTGTGSRTNTIDSFECRIFDSTNYNIENPLVSSTNGYSSKTVDSGSSNVTMQQYFTNATFVFRPPFKSSIGKYKIQLYLSGAGTFSYNTDVSTRVINAGTNYYDADGT
jgi:hypothetical protein